MDIVSLSTSLAVVTGFIVVGMLIFNIVKYFRTKELSPEAKDEIYDLMEKRFNGAGWTPEEDKRFKELIKNE